MPDRETVKKIIAKLKTTADSVFFFDNLKTAAWVRPLFDEKFFSDPPAGEETDGGVRFPSWPASRFLERVVDQAPEIIVDVVSKIPRTNNPNVNRDIVSIALKVPPKLATRLIDHIISGIESVGWNQEFYGQLIVHLVEGCEIKSALQISRKLLEFLPDPEQEQKRAMLETDDPLTWMKAHLEPYPRTPVYLYQRILENYIPSLAKAAPIETIRLLASLLDDAIALGIRDIEKAEAQDWSSVWYPTLDSPSHRLDYDAKATLTASLMDFMERTIAADPRSHEMIDKILSSHQWHIFERMRIRLATQFPDNARQQIRHFLLGILEVEGTDLNEEYFDLLNKHFDQLSETERNEIIAAIFAGPDLKMYVERQYGRDRSPSKQEIDAYVQRWKIFRLFPIKKYLTTNAADEYQHLLQGRPEPSHRNYIHFHPHVETSWGPHSPKTEEELSAEKPLEVLDFLKTWEAVKGYNTPSPEGLARAFQQAVAQQSSKFSREAAEFTGIEPAYIRGLITGLADAVKNNQSIDWPETLKLCKWVVTQNVEIEGRSTQNWDWEKGDPNWRSARKAIANLIQKGSYTGPAEIPILLRNDIFEILSILVDDTDPTAEYEKESGWKNQPATLAINTVRGDAMHALICHAMWIYRHLPKPERKGFTLMPEVQKILEQKLDLKSESTFAIRSVYGQYFTPLCSIDSEWVKRCLPLIFPFGEQIQYRNAAWNTYVTFNRPNAKTFPILLREYERAVDSLNDSKGTEYDLGDPDESLAEHLISLCAWGILDFGSSDSLLNRFYSQASDEIRGHGMEFMGKILDEDETPLPEEPKKRLIDLWEKRICKASLQHATESFDKELLGFGWWLHSEKFEHIWLLDQTQKVLKLCKTVDHGFLFTEALAHFSVEFPVDAARCLLLLVEKMRPEQSFLLHREDVEVILKAAFENKEAKETAKIIKDNLLVRGHFEYQSIGPAQ